MRSGSGRRLVTAAGTCVFVVFAGWTTTATSAVARVSSTQSAALTTSSGWGTGVEAVLPADAAATQQDTYVSLSCPSAGNCSAVGPYTDRSGNRQLALLTESAGTWTPATRAVLPANAAAVQSILEIDAMSCPAPGNCSAVGTYTDSAGNWQGLLLNETAGTWSPAIEAALPADAFSRQMVGLLAISCASAGNCTAVGAYFANDAGGLAGLLLTETAGTWATGVEATLPANAVRLDPPIGLVSVSCASAANCSAVGGYMDSSNNSHGLLLTETDGSWGPGRELQLSGNAEGTPFAYLNDVSCPSAGYCSAVGSYTDSLGNQEGLLVTETARNWSPGTEAVLPAHAATTQQRVSISPLSCPSAGECSAVGMYLDSAGNQYGFLLTETGGAWSPGIDPVLPANAATTKEQALSGPPSCPSVGDCVAVGSYTDNSGESEGLVLTETDGTWSPGSEVVLPANAATTEQNAGINRLSCPSAGNCGAVGSYIDSSGNRQGLLLTETSGKWTAEEASLPANAKTPDASPSLTAISCPSAGNCSAAGSYADDSSGGGSATLLIGGSAPAVKVDISTAGKGAGTVSSTPVGIDCGSTCSTSFEAGTSLTLTATPAAGFRFSGWSGGGCTGTRICQVNTGITEQTVTATFSLPPKPKPCVVPKLKGETVKTAKRAIKTHHCTVGKVKRATSPNRKKGLVISQKPKKGTRLKHGARVSFVVGKGKR